MPEPIQEVLKVKIDPTEFKTGIDELKKAWAGFVDSIGSENVGKIFSAEMIGGITDGVGKISDIFQSTARTLEQSINVFAEKAGTALDTVVNKGKTSSEKLAEQDRAANEKRLESFKGISAEIELEQQGLADREVTRQELAAEQYERWWGKALRTKELQSDEAANRAALREEEAAKKASEAYIIWWEKALRLKEISQEDADVKAAERAGVAADKAVNAQIKADDRRAASSRKTDEEITIAHQAAEEEHELLQERAIAAQIKADDRRAASARHTDEEITIGLQSAEDRYEELLERQRLAQQKAAEKQGSNSFFGGLAGERGIGAQLGSVVRFALEWQLVGTAINGVMQTISAPFKALGEGIKYLQETDRTAEVLTGVLIENVKYSEDLAENFEKAHSAAGGVVRALQDMAIRDKIKPEVLQNTFNNVLEAGAGRGVNDTEGLLKVAEGLATAFQTLGVTAKSSRTEILAALNGAPAAGSKFLELMKMTSDEWVKQRTLAYENGTLVELITSRTNEFTEAAKRGSDTQEGLIARVDLLKTRLEAVFAQETYGVFQEALRTIAEWFDANKESTEQWAAALGSVAGALATIATDSESLSLLGSLGKTLAYGFGTAALLIGGIVSDVKDLASYMIAIAKYPLGTSRSVEQRNDDIKQDFARILKNSQKDGKALDQSMANLADEFLGNRVDYRKQRKTKLLGEIDEARDSVDSEKRFGTPESAKKASDHLNQLYKDYTKLNEVNSLKDKITPGSLPPPPKVPKGKADPSELPYDMVMFRGELTALKAETKAADDEINLSVLKRKLSQDDATKAILKNAESERDSIEELAYKYRELISSSKDGKTPAGRQRIATDLEVVNNAEASAIGGSDAAYDAANKSGIERGFKEQARSNEEQSKRIEQTLKDRLANLQTLNKTGLANKEQTLVAEVAAEFDAYNARKVLYNKEVEDAGTDETLQNTAKDKLKDNDTKYTDFVIRNAEQRIDAHRTEADKQVEHLATMASLSSDRSSALDTILDSFSGRPNLEAFNKKSNSIDESRSSKQKTLDGIKDLPGKQDEIDKLEKEIGALDIEKLKTIAALMSAIRGDKYLSPGAKEKLLENAVKDQGSVFTTAAKNERKQQASDTFQGDLFGTPDLFGDLKKQGADAGSAFDKSAEAAQAFGNALNAVVGLLVAMSQGRKQGGSLGGIGAGLSNGTVDAGLNAILPGLGNVANAMGTVLSIIGASMVAQTIRMANGIKDAISAIDAQYAAHSINLAQTLSSLQAERAAADALKDRAGGWDQYVTIIKSLDPQIASLTLQINQLGVDFSNAFNSLQLHLETNTDALSSVYNSWVGINKQVNDYINAGGDIASAATYLSNQLLLIQKTSQETLNQGQQQAVQDAISLNQLLFQRTQLVQSLNTQVFALQNQDATERTQAGAVTRAQQLAQLQRDNSQQLNDLNYQIDTATLKVTAESTIFNLASTTAALHRQDDSLTQKSLDLQIAKYTALQELVKGITLGDNGLYSSSADWLTPIKNLIGPTVTLNGGINITVVAPNGADPTTVGTTIGNSVAVEIQRASRSAPLG